MLFLYYFIFLDIFLISDFSQTGTPSDALNSSDRVHDLEAPVGV